ncbi:unnamed protein product [Linum trigynum]|uniref:Uncharacterized protein n=1 Tax=Linum trigynum TaxID=586398 RepID=A0AAV2FBZ7_9ROSI
MSSFISEIKVTAAPPKEKERDNIAELVKVQSVLDQGRVQSWQVGIEKLKSELNSLLEACRDRPRRASSNPPTIVEALSLSHVATLASRRRTGYKGANPSSNTIGYIITGCHQSNRTTIRGAAVGDS